MTTGSRWRIRVTCVGLLDGLFHGPSSYSTLTFKWSKIGFFCGHHSPHTSSIRQIYTLPQKRQGIGLKVCLFFFVLAGCRSCGGTMFFFWGGACFTYQWFISSSADWLQDSWPTSMENLHEFFLFGSLVVSDIGSGAWCLLPITSELCTQIHLRDLPAHPSRGVTCVFFWNCSFFWWQHSPEKKGGQTEQTKKQERNKAKPNQTKSNKQQKSKQTKPTNQTTKQTQFFCLFGGRHFVLQPLQQSDSLVFLGFGFGWKTGGWRAQAAKGYVVLP